MLDLLPESPRLEQEQSPRLRSQRTFSLDKLRQFAQKRCHETKLDTLLCSRNHPV